jgi:dTDP-4-amino-4,6-dideoxygalactose transaminase
MTSGSWSRFTRETSGYDAVGLGYNYRLDEPRAALLVSRLRRLNSDVARRRELTLACRRKLRAIDGLTLPYEDADVERSTCYVMPVVVDHESRRDDVRRHLRERHGVQTSLFYPAIHEFTAYRDASG